MSRKDQHKYKAKVLSLWINIQLPEWKSYFVESQTVRNGNKIDTAMTQALQCAYLKYRA